MLKSVCVHRLHALKNIPAAVLLALLAFAPAVPAQTTLSLAEAQRLAVARSQQLAAQDSMIASAREMASRNTASSAAGSSRTLPRSTGSQPSAVISAHSAWRLLS